MRLSAITLEKFGLFSGRLECSFPHEVALVLGDNETGKSTLVAAIGAILFGLNDTEKALFAPAPEGSPRSGSLTIETRGKSYRISRDFGANRAKVELLGDGASALFEGVARPAGRSDEKERYSQLLGMIFGIESRDLFTNSILVEQGKLPAQMEGVLRRIVSGGASADYALVLKRLKERCEQLTVSVSWGRSASRKARQIELLDQEIRSAKSILEDYRAAAASIGRLRERFRALAEKVAADDEALSEKTAWQKKLDELAAALEAKRLAGEGLNRCRKEKEEIGRLERELDRIRAEIEADYTPYLDLPEGAEKELAELSAQKRAINELQERRRQCVQAPPRLSVPKSMPAAVVLGLALAAAGVFFLHGPVAAFAVLTGVAAAAAPFVLAYARLQSDQSAHRGKMSEIDEQLGVLLHQREEREARYPLLAAGESEEVLERLHALRRLQNENEKKREALAQHRDKDEVEREFNERSNELIAANHRLSLLREQHPSLTDIERENRIGYFREETRRDLERRLPALRELVRERDDIHLQLAAAEAREALPEESLEEEIAEKQARLERLKLYREAYLNAVDTLEAAVSEFRSSHLARIEEKTGRYLSEITGAQCKVCLDKDLNPLYIEQAGRKFATAQLSRGAQDQLFFSLRLAAIGEICGEVALPIILDDPFVNFDEERLAAAQHMLDALAASHQIILLTHDRRYCAWREPALRLGGPG